MYHNPFQTISRIGQRSTSAVLARAGTESSALRAHLNALMEGTGKPESFLKEPLIEAAHGFVTAEERLGDLAGTLLREDVVSALDGAGDTDPEERERYRFRRDWRPFRHQVESWRALLEPKPNSVLVTSGTGSGKTECFLVPILNSLAGQAAAGASLTGVQAIMLYPLNALINSQRERLSDWTSPFKGKIRFALFNGETPKEMPEVERQRRPEEVIDRKKLRETPPPILVTNVTMLEYMLVRFEDRPILETSQGKLRYIILDEAHTYVGSQAAELSLLLRRVLLAFGVKPQDVRFVATSATIGTQGDRETSDGLRKFLAQVAGVSETKVVVIEGLRKRPALPPARPGARLPSAETLQGLNPEQLFDVLGSSPDFLRGFSEVVHNPIPLKRWCEAIGTTDSAYGTAVLRAGASAEKRGEKLLPLRIHAFHRAQSGAWACINPSCQGRNGTPLADESWAFGAVHLERSDLCPDCTSPMLEVKFCSNCGQVSLAAQKNPDKQGREWLALSPSDEEDDDFFSPLEGLEQQAPEDEAEPDAQDDAPAEAIYQKSRKALVAPSTVAWGSLQRVNPTTGQILDQAAEGATEYRIQGNQLACPYCAASFTPTAAKLLSVRMGAPFLLGSIVPELLDDASAAPTPKEKGKPDTRIRPADGRVVLMFTDSRQGTARLSAKLQRDAEQNHLRAFIYHMLQASRDGGGAEERQQLETQVADLRKAVAFVPGVATMLEDMEARLASLDQPKAVKWDSMVQKIVQDKRIDRFIRQQVWVEREPDFENSATFAQFLLLREFLRQPVRGNSVETMGLGALQFEHFESLSERQVPTQFSQRGGALKDWRDFLYIAMTRFARQNWCVGVLPNIKHWISHRRSALKVIAPPGASPLTSGQVGWPAQCYPDDRRYLVRLLAQGLGLSLESAGDRDDIDQCLSRAWSHFVTVCEPAENGYRLSFANASLAALSQAFLCPVVPGLVRDRAFRGISPFTRDGTKPFPTAEAIALPALPYPFNRTAEAPAHDGAIEDWLAESEEVRELRRRRVWSDLHDRIAKYSVYFRAAEHSAQQTGKRLKEYEKEFKAGRINVLSCSTTMEMGVDIGSISTVVMTNVPPSIASYRQRVGRAGRRGEAMALSLTFCKDRPIDRAVFRDPRAFLSQTIYAPAVALDSAVIAKRHVNAMLLARFLGERRSELHKITVGPFFGFRADGVEMEAGTSLGEGFANWLDAESRRSDAVLLDDLHVLLAGTALEGAESLTIDATRDSILKARDGFKDDWEAIRYDLDATKENGGKKTALSMQMRSLVGEYLLSDLAGRGFLPGYGFPTDVVNFDNILFVPNRDGLRQTQSAGDGPNRLYQLRGRPSRQLDLAIRDYAPGSDVVVDGQVYKSAGVALSWKRPVTEENAQKIQSMGSVWRCRNCGTIGTSHATANSCSGCGSTNLIAYRYLKPSGFSCDPWIKPHDKIEEATYVPQKAPWVAAQDGQWVHLSEKDAGRHRSSRSGIVFHHTLGAAGYGYAICLACGRAEPETSPESERPPIPSGMMAHRPLRSKSTGFRCDGFDSAKSPFTIQRHRAFGYEVTTDVFELQLDGIGTSRLALPIAAALRDALARKLGVEDTEMGVTTTQTSGDDGVARWSILIYDKAPGGAGFSVAASAHVEELLAEAAKVLDCPNRSACERGCPECIMCREIEAHEKILDRPGALRFVRTLASKLGLKPELAILGPKTQAEMQPLSDAILREMNASPAAELTLWLLSSPEDWDLARWPALAAAQRLSTRGRSVRLILDAGVLKELDQAARLELYGLAIKTGCRIEAGPVVGAANGNKALAWVGGEREGLAWLSSAIDGATCSAILLRGPMGRPKKGEAVDPAHFLVQPERTSIIELHSDLDGKIEDFGRRFWKLVGNKSALLDQRLQTPGELLQVEYCDRYLNSPLSTRLLREVLANLPGIDKGGSVKVVTADASTNNATSSPTLLRHDWRITSHRDAVLRGILDTDFPGRAQLLTGDKRALPHGRTLRLKYGDASVPLRLDQGFGYWATTAPAPYGFSASIADQTRQLRTASFRIRAGSPHSTFVAVNEER